MIIILFGIIAGILSAIAFDLYIPSALSAYASIVIISAFDSVMSAYKMLLRDKFTPGVLITGFFGNSFLAALMVFVGRKIDLELYQAVVIVFTMRIFSNFSFVRRYYLKKISKKLKKC